MADKNKNIFVEKAQVGLSESYLHANPVKAKRVEKVLLENGYKSVLDATSDPQVENPRLAILRTSMRESRIPKLHTQ